MEDIFEKVISILWCLPVLLFILMVHEYGHYIVARCFGVRMSVFSLGRGEKLWEMKRKSGEHYIVRRYPVAAHVALNEDDFTALSFSKKAAVMAAGPVFNFIFSFVILFLLIFSVGLPSKPPVFNAIEKGKAAFSAGIKHGDRVLSFNGEKIQRFETLRDYSFFLPVKTMDLEVERDGKILHKDVTTIRRDYVDRDGLKQSHGFLGVICFHGPLGLESIKAVNGYDVDGEDQVRSLLLEYMDQNVTLLMEGGDDKNHEYDAWLDKEINAHLNDPDHDHYDEFYLGKMGDHFYLDISFKQSLDKASHLTLKMMKGILTMPYQLFPLDKENIRPETRVFGDDTWIKNLIYKYGFFAAVASILMGFVNLLPIPYFDGGQLAILFYERIVKRRITRKEKFYFIGFLLGSLYISILIPNVNNMPNYIEKQTKKIQKFVKKGL